MRRFFAMAALAVALPVTGALAVASPAAAHVAVQRCSFSSDKWTAQWGTESADSIPYVEAKWTANPCVQRLEVRQFCDPIVGRMYWTGTSGPVKKTGLWTEETCGEEGTDGQGLIGEARYTNSSGNWEPWVTFCAPCASIKQGSMATGSG
jgi:hypothetical protein